VQASISHVALRTLTLTAECFEFQHGVLTSISVKNVEAVGFRDNEMGTTSLGTL